MKKNKIKIICLVFLLIMIPLIISATIFVSFDNAKSNADSYIKNFTDYDLYIDTSTNKYLYDESGFNTSAGFNYGGFLNLLEFNTSKDSEGSTYLFNGQNFWTMTESSENNYYGIDVNAPSKYVSHPATDSLGSRVTEHIYNDVEVSGIGTYVNPWEFEEISRTHTITFRNSANINDVLKTTTINHRENASVDVPMAAGKTAEGAIVSCSIARTSASVSSSSSSKNNGQTLTVNINEVKKDISCLVTQIVRKYAVNISVTNGSSNPLSSQVSHDGSGTYTITPSTGYMVNGATVTGCTGATISDSTLTVPNVTSDRTCAVTLPIIQNTVNVIVTGGTTSPASSQLDYNATGTFTITPSTGYTLTGAIVSGCEGASISGSTLSVPSVTSARTCTVTLPLIKYAVNVTVTGGTTSPTSAQVNHGSSASFTLAASSGYTLTGATVTGCAGATISSSTLTVPSVTAARTCTVTMKPTSYTVTLNANGGSPNSSITVTPNGNYGTLPTPTKSCSIFAGWFTAASGGTQVIATTTVTQTAAHTLYAHWIANTSGGTWGSCTGGYCSGCSATGGTQTNTCGATRSCIPSLDCSTNGYTTGYSASCGYGYAYNSCGGSTYVYIGSCAPSMSCAIQFSPTSLVYNKSGQLTSWGAAAYTSVAGTYSLYTSGFKNGTTCSYSSVSLSAGNNQVGNYTNCGVVDVTSARSGSKCINFSVTHNSSGTSTSCSQCYSWS